MREIKFRAWEQDNKKMVYKIPVPDCILNKWIHRLSDFQVTLMQYTGLKDKNGKEIYEGDIVEGSYMGYQEKITERKEVKFILGEFMIWSRFVTGSNEKLDCIVIGNIYENPNLLTHKPI